MKKRLVITGAGGFVAGSMVVQAGDAWQVHALARKDIALPPGAIGHHVELTDAAQLRDTLDAIRPDAVIHAAAAADIDFCENNRDTAEAVNVGVTREVARFCGENGVRLVHCSTDTVFDGEKGMYRETDPAGPINFYAETKLRAEQIVAADAPGAAVARLSLVMGLPMLGAGNSFLSRMIDALEAGREVGVPGEEIRTPADVVTLGRAILELAGNDFAGIIHLAGNDCMNRFDMSRRIAERLGYPPERVVSKSAAGLPGRAPRPRDVSMDNSLARATLKTPMRGLDDGLDLVLAMKKGAP
jgi:dTDP-4-dehydrorhamnose reductase